MSNERTTGTNEKAERTHEDLMRIALEEAALAAAAGEVPVGAVIVKDGEVIAKAHNTVEEDNDASSHAEMIAMREARRVVGSKWLKGCALYVTLEPCAMCAGAMALARIDELFIGAMDPKNGACGSLFNVACDERLNHRIEVHSGILEAECSEILSGFFRELRKSNKRG